MDAEWARNVLEREVGMAGTRLLQVTKSDLSRAPFHAPSEVSRKFLRSLRVLRLHAFAATAIKQCGAAWKQHGNANDVKRYTRLWHFFFGKTGTTTNRLKTHIIMLGV